MVDVGDVVEERGEEMNVNNFSASTMELVGQMEIEISDQDGSGGVIVSVEETSSKVDQKAQPSVKESDKTKEIHVSHTALR